MQLPAIIATYFDADNRHDADAVAACFTDTGVVHDEDADHAGRAAIAAWKRDTTAKYAVRTAPLSIEGSAPHVVAARVSGNFPGSPLVLRFAFTLAHDGIGALEITA